MKRFVMLILLILILPLPSVALAQCPCITGQRCTCSPTCQCLSPALTYYAFEGYPPRFRGVYQGETLLGLLDIRDGTYRHFTDTGWGEPIAPVRLTLVPVTSYFASPCANGRCPK